MRILKDLLENVSAASTSAGNVSGFRGSLFAPKKGKGKKKKNTMIKRDPVGSIYGFRLVGVKEGHVLSDLLKESEDSDFDASDVLAKMKNAEMASKEESEDTTAFALEDEDGNYVKVWVPDEQADDFHSALEVALSKNDEDEDEDNTQAEIGEVLWSLRKSFDIVNVQWASIPEDQEEELPDDVDVEGDDAEGEGEDDDIGLEDGDEGDDEMVADEGDSTEEDAKTALQSVIDMMKADADAKKAEATARQKEAEADIAKYNAQAEEAQVKKEEETLDMEAYYDKKKEEKKETDRISQLAKYRHDLASDSGETLGSAPPAEDEAPANVEVNKQVNVNVPDEGPEDMPEDMPEDEESYYDTGDDTDGDGYISKEELGDLILRALRRED